MLSNMIYEAVNKMTHEIYSSAKNELAEKNYTGFELNIWDHVEKVVASYILVLIHTESVMNKLVKQVVKAVINEQIQRDREIKHQRKLNQKLWQLTKGKIPCLCLCGHYTQRTKQEVLESSNTYLCPECSKKAEAEDKVMDVFKEKGSIHKVLGIE